MATKQIRERSEKEREERKERITRNKEVLVETKKKGVSRQVAVAQGPAFLPSLAISIYILRYINITKFDSTMICNITPNRVANLQQIMETRMVVQHHLQAVTSEKQKLEEMKKQKAAEEKQRYMIMSYCPITT